MKITVQIGSGPAPTRVTLGDDASGEYISGFLPARESLKQMAARVRASGMKPFDRGNTQTTFSWATARQHASYEASLKFIRDHLLLTPRQGLIEISQTGASGFSLFLADALIDFRFTRLEGVATEVSYVVVGGEVQATAPENSP